jgi:putative alpha-1,2-mannosidase
VYVQKVLLNGRELNRTYITYAEIMNGGRITFLMSDKPKA